MRRRLSVLHTYGSTESTWGRSSSSAAVARMNVEGAPVWNLATLMPDGAVGASAAGGRTVLLAREFAEEHRGRVGRYDAAELALLCQELERVQEALTVSYAYSMLRFDARAEDLLADPALGRFAHQLRGVRRSRPNRLSEPEERILAEKTVTGAGVRQDSRCVHEELIDRNLNEAPDVAAAIPA